jgi:hypothetical protein
MFGRSGGYDEAEDLIRQGMGEQRQLEQGAERGFDPYSAAGAQGLNMFQQALAEGRDPMALLNKYMAGYRESPEFKAQLEAGQEQANRAAAASGMIGSSAEMQNAAARAQAMRSQDMQNYLSQVLGLRGQYLGGEQGLAGMGLRSAEDIMRGRSALGQQLGQGYGALAQSEIAKGQQPSFFDQLMGGVGTIGGALLGGPAGAAIGGAAGNYLFGGGGGGGGGQFRAPAGYPQLPSPF